MLPPCYTTRLADVSVVRANQGRGCVAFVSDWPPRAVPELQITTLNDTVSDANAEKQCIYSVLKIDLRSSKPWGAGSSPSGAHYYSMNTPCCLPPVFHMGQTWAINDKNRVDLLRVLS